MAKVGSKTIVGSLVAADPTLEVYHSHTLTPAGLADAERRMEKLPGRFWNHLDKSRNLSRRIRLSDDSKPWQVISLVRDPVARDVSKFFECLHIIWPEVGRRFVAGQVTVNMLVKLFHEHLSDESPLHFVPRPVDWFDVEIRPLFKIDVFSEPFPRDVGFKVFSSTKAVLLVFKLEMLNECIGPAMRSFLNVSDFKLVRSNVSEQKAQLKHKRYYQLYEEFRRNVTFPAEYLRDVYGSKLVKHFYTPLEIEKFRGRWCRGVK